MRQKKETHLEHLKGKGICEGLGDREGTRIRLVLFILLTNQQDYGHGDSHHIVYTNAYTMYILWDT